jgi:rare lipoprotein A
MIVRTLATAVATLSLASMASGSAIADTRESAVRSSNVQSGIASIYSVSPRHQRTATGARLNNNALTAAHRTLPFGTAVKVVNKRNGRSVVVTINDRGPFIRGRIIDLTPAGARSLGFSGLTHVTVERVAQSAAR